MNKRGSGILCFRYNGNNIEFLLVCKTFSTEFLKILTSRYKKENLNISKISIFESFILKNFKIGDIWKEYFGYKSDKYMAHINKKFDEYKKYMGNEFLKDVYCTDCQMWEIPKGHIEEKEDSDECALREFEEESGISRNNIRFYKNIKRVEKIKYYKITYIVTYYLSEYVGKYDIDIIEVNKNNEIICSKWFTIDEIKYLNIDSSKYKIILNLYKKIIFNNY